MRIQMALLVFGGVVALSSAPALAQEVTPQNAQLAALESVVRSIDTSVRGMHLRDLGLSYEIAKELDEDRDLLLQVITLVQLHISDFHRDPTMSNLVHLMVVNESVPAQLLGLSASIDRVSRAVRSRQIVRSIGGLYGQWVTATVAFRRAAHGHVSAVELVALNCKNNQSRALPLISR